MKKCTSKDCPHWHETPWDQCWSCRGAAHDSLSPEQKWRKAERVAESFSGTALGPVFSHLAQEAMVEAFPDVIMVTQKGEA